MTDNPNDSTENRQPERFGAAYWQEETHYGQLGDYAHALDATMRWYRALFRLVDPLLPRGGRHLDVGCGHGAMVQLMLQRGFDAYGLDASQWMIDQIREARPEFAEHFAVGDAAAPYPFEGTFDVITCIEVLEHLEQPEQALEQIVGRLGAGGIVVITTPNPQNFMPFRNPATNDPTHVSVHVPDWWRERIRVAGLSIVTSPTYLALPALWRFSPALSRWLTFRHDVGPGWLAVARAQRPVPAV